MFVTITRRAVTAYSLWVALYVIVPFYFYFLPILLRQTVSPIVGLAVWVSEGIGIMALIIGRYLTKKKSM